VNWFRKLISSSPEASYGRLISFLSFIVFNIYFVLISINPHHLFTNLAYTSEVFHYLFYLILAGYSITALKEALNGGFDKYFNKGGTLITGASGSIPAPVTPNTEADPESGSAKPDQS
jgi:hypothetical protein